MANPLVLKVTCVVVVLIVGFGDIIPLAEAEIPCGTVQMTVAPCIAYLTGPSGTPIPAPCCNGAKRIIAQAKTTPDLQGMCTCLKNTVYRVPGLNPSLLAALPSSCGINLPYKISPSMDCTKIT